MKQYLCQSQVQTDGWPSEKHSRPVSPSEAALQRSEPTRTFPKRGVDESMSWSRRDCHFTSLFHTSYPSTSRSRRPGSCRVLACLYIPTFRLLPSLTFHLMCWPSLKICVVSHSADKHTASTSIHIHDPLSQRFHDARLVSLSRDERRTISLTRFSQYTLRGDPKTTFATSDLTILCGDEKDKFNGDHADFCVHKHMLRKVEYFKKDLDALASVMMFLSPDAG